MRALARQVHRAHAAHREPGYRVPAARPADPELALDERDQLLQVVALPARVARDALVPPVRVEAAVALGHDDDAGEARRGLLDVAALRVGPGRRRRRRRRGAGRGRGSAACRRSRPAAARSRAAPADGRRRSRSRVAGSTCLLGVSIVTSSAACAGAARASTISGGPATPSPSRVALTRGCGSGCPARSAASWRTSLPRRARAPGEGHRRARDGAGLARRRAARGALPARGRDARVPVARRPGPPPRRVPRRGGRAHAARSAPRCARPTRAPAARRSAPRRPPACGTWRTASSSASRRGPRSKTLRALHDDGVARHGRPARRGDRVLGRGRPLRRALRRGARDARRSAMASLARASREPNLSVKVSALTPALRPEAPELGRDDAAGAAAAAARAGARPRRPPARRHGVARLARDDARARVRAARRGRVPRRPVGRARAPGLPARLARRARADPRLGARRRARGRRSRSGSSRAPTGTTR